TGERAGGLRIRARGGARGLLGPPDFPRRPQKHSAKYSSEEVMAIVRRGRYGLVYASGPFAGYGHFGDTLSAAPAAHAAAVAAWQAANGQAAQAQAAAAQAVAALNLAQAQIGRASPQNRPQAVQAANTAATIVRPTAEAYQKAQAAIGPATKKAQDTADALTAAQVAANI